MAFETIGVRAVVEGASQYISDLNRSEKAEKDVTAAAKGLETGSKAAGKGMEDAGHSASGFGSQVSSFKDKLSGLLPVLTGVATAIGVAFEVKKAISSTIELGTEVKQMTRELGISAEEASKLHFAAQETGVGFSTLEGTMTKFSKALAGVSDSEDLTFQVGQALKDNLAALGITVEDTTGKARPLNDILGDTAEVFKGLPDGAQKTTLAIQLFGRSGKDLIPFLNKGRDGIKELGDEAERLGLVLDTKAIGSITRYKQAQKDFKAALEGVQTQIGLALIPVLTIFAENSAQMATKFNTLVVPAIRALADILNDYVIPAVRAFIREDIIGPFQALANTIYSAAAPALQSLRDKLGGVMETLDPVIGTIKGNLDIIGIFTGSVVGLAGGLIALSAAGDLVDSSLTALGILATLVTSSLGITVLVISALVAGVVLLAKNWDLLTTKFPVLGRVSDAVGRSLGNVRAIVKTIIDDLPHYISLWAEWTRKHEVFASVILPIPTLILVIADNLDRIKRALQTGWEAVTSTFQNIVDSASDLVDLIPSLGIPTSVTDSVKDYALAFYTADWGDIADQLERVRDAAAPGVEGAANGVSALAEAWDAVSEALQPAIDKLSGPFMETMGNLNELFSALNSELKEQLGPVLQSLAPLFEELSNTFATMAPLIEPTAKIIGSILVGALYALLEVLNFLMPIIQVVMVEALQALGLVFQVLAGIITSNLQVIQGTFIALQGLFTGDWDRLWEGVQTIFEGVWTAISTIFIGALDGLTIATEAFFDVLNALTLGKLGEWKDAFVNAITEVVHFFEGLKDKVLDALGVALDWLTQTGTDIIVGMKNAIVAAWPLIVVGIFAAKDAAIKGIGNPADWLVGVGWDIIRGLGQGMLNAATSIIPGIVANIGGMIKDGFTGITGFITGSPSKWMAEKVGLPIAQGIAVGMQDGAPGVLAAVADLVNSVDSAFLDELATWAQEAQIAFGYYVSSIILTGGDAMNDNLLQLTEDVRPAALAVGQKIATAIGDGMDALVNTAGSQLTGWLLTLNDSIAAGTDLTAGQLMNMFKELSDIVYNNPFRDDIHEWAISAIDEMVTTFQQGKGVSDDALRDLLYGLIAETDQATGRVITSSETFGQTLVNQTSKVLGDYITTLQRGLAEGTSLSVSQIEDMFVQMANAVDIAGFPDTLQFAIDNAIAALDKALTDGKGVANQDIIDLINTIISALNDAIPAVVAAAAAVASAANPNINIDPATGLPRPNGQEIVDVATGSSAYPGSLDYGTIKPGYVDPVTGLYWNGKNWQQDPYYKGSEQYPNADTDSPLYGKGLPAGTGSQPTQNVTSQAGSFSGDTSPRTRIGSGRLPGGHVPSPTTYTPPTCSCPKVSPPPPVIIDMRNTQMTGTPQDNERMMLRVVNAAIAQQLGRGATNFGVIGNIRR